MQMPLEPRCFRCGNPLNPLETGRRDACDKCTSDIHVCKNCRHYDPSVYNECREIQADRVVDKERSNFCDYFSLGATGGGGGQEAKSDTLKKLDDLFKK